ncbi:ABC-2 type transport system permease protein [Austwickia chelonae]|uniref:ABC transporter permease protein n=1 Tax=Austwickia chelonae NBRC 105200 TaxID=1184607 RepID=K6VQZ7_9MICO|nr:ABC transporter permease [Austwickia chelonae]GAB79169.1 hypothetical protein AUCHE_20_00410 [Austwickia chelonae NBRC 105200]SEW42888.1 ABC-2 type transport system permease protein [Austwickia chelonae]
MSTFSRRPLAWHVELRRQLRRRRTVWSYALLVALPVVLVVAFSFGERDRSGGSAARLVDLAQQGSANFTIFTVFAAADFLLIVVAALFAGDTLPSEASWSSLRYLLAAPVPRARLLTAKLAVAVGSMVAAVVVLVVSAVVVGGVAYGWAPYTATGGFTLGWSEFLPRLLLGAACIAVSLLQVCGIAFLIGTRTDSPLAAAGGAVLVTIVSSILQTIDALGDLRHALPMAYSRTWFQAFSSDISWVDIQRGALWSSVYFLATVATAYILFRRKDVLS